MIKYLILAVLSLVVLRTSATNDKVAKYFTQRKEVFAKHSENFKGFNEEALWSSRSLMPPLRETSSHQFYLDSIQFLETEKDDLTTQFEYYQKLNAAETRLPEFADDDSSLYLKVVQLQVINESRLKYNCKPVKLDILACRVANKMAKDAAEGGYVGHWNRAGEKPYHRWAFAGGKDHVAENAYGEWSSAKYKKDSFTIDSLMKAGHKAFITEKHPNDGHKQNIIYRPHTHVGLGYYLVDRHFTYYEEFLDRYYVFENQLKPSYNPNEKIELIVKCDSSIGLTNFYASKEKKIKPMNPVKITLKGSYFDGTGKITFFDLPKREPDGSYKLEFSFKKKGLYYLQIFHRVYDEKGRLVGKEVQASGVLVRVE